MLLALMSPTLWTLLVTQGSCCCLCPSAPEKATSEEIEVVEPAKKPGASGTCNSALIELQKETGAALAQARYGEGAAACRSFVTTWKGRDDAPACSKETIPRLEAEFDQFTRHDAAWNEAKHGDLNKLRDFLRLRLNPPMGSPGPGASEKHALYIAMCKTFTELGPHCERALPASVVVKARGEHAAFISALVLEDIERLSAEYEMPMVRSSRNAPTHGTLTLDVEISSDAQELLGTSLRSYSLAVSGVLADRQGTEVSHVLTSVRRPGYDELSALEHLKGQVAGPVLNDIAGDLFDGLSREVMDSSPE